MRLPTTVLGLASLLLPSVPTASALSVPSSRLLDRRSAVAAVLSAPVLVASSDPAASLDAAPRTSSPLPSGFSNPNPRAVASVTIDSPRQSAGLELYQVTIGTPSRPVVAVKSVRPGGIAANANVRPGMVFLDYARAEEVLKRLSDGPYPVQLRLYDLAMGGDAIGDLGRGIVTSEDALELARGASGPSGSGSGGAATTPGGSDGTSGGFVVKTIKEARGECVMTSRRGDTMLIRYDAHVGDRNGEIYDSSAIRGTGQPYAYVLGNGDVLRGVDLGTYDMCPGEVRELSIPPELGYRGGSRLYKQIPPNSPLFWRVELVELNFVKEGENDASRDELEGRY